MERILTGCRGILSSFFAEVRYCNLSSHIAELRPYSKEEIVLLPQWSRNILCNSISWVPISASVISGIGAKEKITINKPTKPAKPRYVHWTFLSP
jgi:hypothetical protein